MLFCVKSLLTYIHTYNISLSFFQKTIKAEWCTLPLSREAECTFLSEIGML